MSKYALLGGIAQGLQKGADLWMSDKMAQQKEERLQAIAEKNYTRARNDQLADQRTATTQRNKELEDSRTHAENMATNQITANREDTLERLGSAEYIAGERNRITEELALVETKYNQTRDALAAAESKGVRLGEYTQSLVSVLRSDAYPEMELGEQKELLAKINMSLKQSADSLDIPEPSKVYPEPSQLAIDDLLANPGRASIFETEFGADALARIMAQKPEKEDGPSKPGLLNSLPSYQNKYLNMSD